MRDDKFKISNCVKELIYRIDENLINFPKKEIELKKAIRNYSYELLLVVQEANITNSMQKRLELIEKAISLVKQIDFLINICEKKMIINSKKYYKFGESLDRIIRYLIAWMNATKETITKRA